MSINIDKDDDSNSNNNQTNKPAPAPIVKEQPKQAAPQPQQSNTNHNQSNNTQPIQGNRTMNVSARQNYGMQRAARSDAMRMIVEVTDKLSASMPPNSPVKFHYAALDAAQEGLLISSLVVSAYLANPNTDQKFVAYHVLLLDATAQGASVVEQQTQIGNQSVKYERLVVAADALDGTLRGRVLDVVKSQFPGYNLIDADATVVPKNLDLKSEEAVRNVIANATTASSTLLTSVIANDAWVIDADAIKQTFQNEVKTSWDHFIDLTGNPVRGDIVLEMSVLIGKNQNQNNNGGEFQYNTSQARRLITQIYGYIDLINTPATVSSMGGVAIATKQEELKNYTPRYVITNMDAPEEAPELPIILQGFATAQALANNGNWVNALVQQHKNGAAHATGGVNIRDLSVMGLEVPQFIQLGHLGGELPKPQRLPMNSAAMGDAVISSNVQTYINDYLLISMDVPECGAASWMLSPLAAAARGDKDAIRDIFEAADLLTGGLFTGIYKSMNQGAMPDPFLNDNMFVNLGYYNTAAGNRDIRDGDYLAFANATADGELQTKGALVTLNDWQNLQANWEVDPMFRLTETRRIQQDLFESMVITGRAVRITAYPTFVRALAEAVHQAGLVYETKMGMSAPQSNARMVPQYMRNLPTNMGNAGGFVASGMRRSGPQGVTNNSFGRYSHNNNRSNGQPGSGNF